MSTCIMCDYQYYVCSMVHARFMQALVQCAYECDTKTHGHIDPCIILCVCGLAYMHIKE